MSLKLIFLTFFISISLSSSSCIVNQNNCTKCNWLTNLCISCSPKEIFVPDSEGGCTGNKNCIPGYNYCKECDNSNNCKTCEIGYYPDEIGGCTYTENCKYSLRGECLLCREDYILIGNAIKLCKYIFSENLMNCEEINYSTGLCNNCSESYYKNSKDNKCIETGNCSLSLYGICKKCDDGYYLDKTDEQCKLKTDNFLHCKETIDGNNCEECDDNYFLASDGNCTNVNYCQNVNISNNFKCIECISGYYLTRHGNVCTNEKNCIEAEQITGNCFSCINSFYLNANSGNCFSNLENNDYKFCKKVFSNTCIECISGYFLGGDNKCSDTEKCAISKNGECQKCNNEYFLDEAKKCHDIKNCKYSSQSYSGYICKECNENYFYNFTSNKCELAQSREFENCLKTDKDGKTCSECKKNYYISIQYNICYNNTEEGPFYKCAKVNDYLNKCIECESGYYLGSRDNLCKISDCEVIENGNKCNECNNEYCLDVKNGICVKNSYPPKEKSQFAFYNCKKTNENGDACQICEESFDVKDGYCFNNEMCESYEGGICEKCKGNEDDDYCLNKNFGCVWTYVSNCLRCDYDLNFNMCTECMEGYVLNEYNECVDSY